METWELGVNKKSFSLHYAGGEIWCEHLDHLFDKIDLLKIKLSEDLTVFKRPSVSSHIIVILDETDLKEGDIESIFYEISHSGKQIRKMAFTGLNKKLMRTVTKISRNAAFPVACINDLEKAKEWIL